MQITDKFRNRFSLFFFYLLLCYRENNGNLSSHGAGGQFYRQKYASKFLQQPCNTRLGNSQRMNLKV